jgi:hypothetical protein
MEKWLVEFRQIYLSIEQVKNNWKALRARG